MTAKGYRRDKRRTRRRSYRRDEISRVVEGVLKSRRHTSGQTGDHSGKPRSALIDAAEPPSGALAPEAVCFEPLHPGIERILDFAKLLDFVRQEAALILDDEYCQDLLTLCIDRIARQYELSPEEQHGPAPNKLVH